MTDDERVVLQQIMQVIGPEATCECQGCAWEFNEAIRLLKSLGIEYQHRGRKHVVAHDVAAERRGNETS